MVGCKVMHSPVLLEVRLGQRQSNDQYSWRETPDPAVGQGVIAAVAVSHSVYESVPLISRSIRLLFLLLFSFFPYISVLFVYSLLLLFYFITGFSVLEGYVLFLYSPFNFINALTVLTALFAYYS